MSDDIKLPELGQTYNLIATYSVRHDHLSDIDRLSKWQELINSIKDYARAAVELNRAVQWPTGRDIGRIGDMSRSAHIRVGLDGDNDVYVSVFDESGGGVVEFCTTGSGGGKSPRTRDALIALMVAIEADNAELPSRDWWAVRNGKVATAHSNVGSKCAEQTGKCSESGPEHGEG